MPTLRPILSAIFLLKISFCDVGIYRFKKITILFSAVIPVTDAEHTLLNVHFSVDPGPDFVWGQDEYDPGIMSRLMQSGEPAEHLTYLAIYLDLVRVPLPEWLLDHVDHNNHATG